MTIFYRVHVTACTRRVFKTALEIFLSAVHFFYVYLHNLILSLSLFILFVLLSLFFFKENMLPSFANPWVRYFLHQDCICVCVRVRGFTVCART